MDIDRNTIDDIEDWARETIGATDMEEVADDIQYDNEEELVETLAGVSDETLGGFE